MGVGVGLSEWRGSQSHRRYSKLEIGRPRAPQCIKLSVPQSPNHWAQAASVLTGPSKMLRELWHCPPAPAGTAASAVGSRPGRGRQEAEARMTAEEEAVLQMDGPAAFGD